MNLQYLLTKLINGEKDGGIAKKAGAILMGIMAVVLSPFIIVVALFSPTNIDNGSPDPYPLAIQAFKEKYDIDRVTFSADDIKAIEMTLLETDLNLATKEDIEARLEGYTYISTLVKEETVTTLNNNEAFICDDFVYPDLTDTPEENRPNINVDDLIVMELDTETDFLSYITVVETTVVSLDTSNIDFNNVGQYPLLISVKDEAGYQNYKTVTIQIEPTIKQVEIRVLNLSKIEDLKAYLVLAYDFNEEQLEDVEFFLEMRKYFGSGNGEMMLTPQVLEYKDLVEKYCSENGIADFVDYVLCIMQQESGGKGIDVMQCKESGMGVITTPEDSICYGVAYFKRCLDSAMVQSSLDQEKIKLAIQGYNFGSGYIEWAKDGYSLESAYTYSEIKKKELGWAEYGDPEYVPHVLRYYGTALTVEGDLKTVIDIACQQVGKPYVWGAAGPDEFDCSGLMQWAYAQAGITIGRTTWDQVENGVMIGMGELQPGDLIFFHTMEGEPPTHVGLYLGGGAFVHAASEEVGVIYSDLNTPYWQGVYYASRRIINATE